MSAARDLKSAARRGGPNLGYVCLEQFGRPLCATSNGSSGSNSVAPTVRFLTAVDCRHGWQASPAPAANGARGLPRWFLAIRPRTRCAGQSKSFYPWATSSPRSSAIGETQSKTTKKPPGRNSQPAAGLDPIDNGCILEPGRAFDTIAILVSRERSCETQARGVKDWPERRVVGVCNRGCDHVHMKLSLKQWAPNLNRWCVPELRHRSMPMSFVECARLPRPSTRAKARAAVMPAFDELFSAQCPASRPSRPRH